MTEDEQQRVLQAVEEGIQFLGMASTGWARSVLWIGGKPYLISVERSALWPRT